MPHRVVLRNEFHSRDRQVAGKTQIAGQFRQRLDFRGHDDPLPLYARGAAAAPAAIVRTFALGFPLDLVLAEALAQVFGRLAVRTAATEHEDVSKAAPQYGRVLFAVGALELRRRLDAGHDSKAVFSAFGQRVFEGRQLLQAVQLVDHHPEPPLRTFGKAQDRRA